MTRHSLRTPRFARTADEAFRTPRYAAAIEIPWPPLWRRVLHYLREVFS